MDRNQVKDRASEQKGKAQRVADKVADGESAEHKRNSEKHDGKDGAVLADINDSSRKDKE
ncbi:hypothetical protein [Halomonas kalidii]|uniref:CsbD family protein n=1 Tax=Halomonas kalidii TaxID=3043293 RepID=A0ABT6VNP9_9GAMM|nr:hypothetical protein [Halomonas kalidii]MDI5935625.1 hypothetical protein [Halomonas kalidii]